MSKPRPGEIKHILRPYRTWNSPLAIPDAGDDTATRTDTSLIAVFHVPEHLVALTQPNLVILRIFWHVDVAG
jgi:hypothetical protein